jgi:exonuclease III
MSNSSHANQKIKLYGITKLRTDVIFLSDVRISNKNLVSVKNEVSNVFLLNPYEKYQFYANSSMNKRGVGILIKYDLQAEIKAVHKDAEENILALYTTIKGTDLLLVSIYGPNNNNVDFFDFLRTICDRYRNTNIIIAGDWNCTYSTDPLAENIDCFNMKRLPNIAHSRLVSNLCDDFNLADPFRILHPDSRDACRVMMPVLTNLA